MPSVLVITPPAVQVVSLSEAKRHLRVDHTDDDAYITTLIDVAIGAIDGPAGWLGRSLVKQTLELRLDRFDQWYGQPGYSWTSGCSAEIILPYPPLLVGESPPVNPTVKYLDTDGNLQTADPTLYRIVGGVDGFSRIVLEQTKSWPSTISQQESVLVRYPSGYGESGADVPAPIRHGILLMIGNYYQYRESVIVATGHAIEMPQNAQSLLERFRVVWPRPDGLRRAHHYGEHGFYGSSHW